MEKEKKLKFRISSTRNLKKIDIFVYGSALTHFEFSQLFQA